MHTASSLTEQLATLCRQGTLQHYDKGEVILRTDQPPPGVFCIKEGYVKVYAITDEGDEHLHIIYGPGMIFPIIWAITGRLRQVFYEAMDDVTVYRIDRMRFLEFLERDAEATAAVLHWTIDTFNVYADQVDNLEYTRSYSRIIYRLLKLAERFGKPLEKGTVIQAPVRHHDIANSANCSRETVSREMEGLEEKGLVRYTEERLIVLPDIPRLQKELLRP